MISEKLHEAYLIPLNHNDASNIYNSQDFAVSKETNAPLEIISLSVKFIRARNTYEKMFSSCGSLQLRTHRIPTETVRQNLRISREIAQYFHAQFPHHYSLGTIARSSSRFVFDTAPSSIMRRLGRDKVAGWPCGVLDLWP